MTNLIASPSSNHAHCTKTLYPGNPSASGQRTPASVHTRTPASRFRTLRDGAWPTSIVFSADRRPRRPIAVNPGLSAGKEKRALGREYGWGCWRIPAPAHAAEVF